MIDTVALAAVGALALTWVGYPMAVAFAARVASRGRVPTERPAPAVTVVLASRDSEEAIADRVANLLDTRYSADVLDVVVSIDRNDPERVAEALGAFGSRVRVVGADAPGGKASALNAAMRHAAGGVTVFADTHQRFEPETIPRLIAAFADARVGCVSGSLRLPDAAQSLATRYWAFERWLRRTEARLHSAVGATGAVYAIRTALWRPLPANLILDDVYTPMQIVLAGYRVAFDEGAIARETRTPSVAQEYGRKVRTLTGVVQLCVWLPAVLVPVRNPIWIQFVCHKLLRLLTPYLLLVVAIWTAVQAAQAIETAPVSARLLMLMAGSLLVVWIGRARGLVAARIRKVAMEGVLLQKAVIVAGFNGLKGRWQVWDA
jgi:cellulose synthase/poly-beta-1,6-N-acetylglucosamine synthase-like glycosyltransferase